MQVFYGSRWLLVCLLFVSSCLLVTYARRGGSSSRPSSSRSSPSRPSVSRPSYSRPAPAPVYRPPPAPVYRPPPAPVYRPPPAPVYRPPPAPPSRPASAPAIRPAPKPSLPPTALKPPSAGTSRPSDSVVVKQPAFNPNFNEPNSRQPAYNPNFGGSRPSGPPPPYSLSGYPVPSAPVGSPPGYKPSSPIGNAPTGIQPPPYQPPVRPPAYPGVNQPYPVQPGFPGNYPKQPSANLPYPIPDPHQPHVNRPYPVQPGFPGSYPNPPSSNRPYPVQPGFPGSYPNQPSVNRPYPVQPGFPGSHPNQPSSNRPYPVQPGFPGSYPNQPSVNRPYPVQPSYPNQPGGNRPYPVQPGSFHNQPGVNRPYPVQPNNPGGYHRPYPQQPLGGNVWQPQHGMPAPAYMNYGGIPTGTNMYTKPHKKKGFIGSLLSVGKSKNKPGKEHKYYGSYPSPYHVSGLGGNAGSGFLGKHSNSAAMYSIFPYMAAKKAKKVFKPKFNYIPVYMPRSHYYGQYHHYHRHHYDEDRDSKYLDLYHDDYAGKCQKPIQKENSEVKCKSSLDDIQCDARCEEGYKFPENITQVSNKCWHVAGVWRPTKNFPECKPVCENKCMNGGWCFRPGVCKCLPEFRGSRCQFHFLRCDILTLTKGEKVGWVCNHFRNESACKIRCREPAAEFASPAADEYRCTPEGVWKPDVLPPCVIKESAGSIQQKK